MYYLLLIPLALIVWIAADVARALLRKKMPARPEPKYNVHETEVLARLARGDSIPDEEFLETMQPSFDWIRNRYDCSDFRLNTLIRMYLQFGDRLPAAVAENIRAAMLEFRYWMDQPGSDSMCFWSENHQILFAAAEYLAGQTFPDEVFANDGKTGREHMVIAKERIDYWFDLRFMYGFSEAYSNTYYVEDLAGMSNLEEFAHDETVRKQMTIAMDLLWYDVATHSVNGAFSPTGNRMYAAGKMRGTSMCNALARFMQQSDVGNGALSSGMLNNFLFNKSYRLPEAVSRVLRDKTPQSILASNGLSVDELDGEGLLGQETRQIMFQMGMEAFTNPEVFHNTIRYLARNKLFTNSFLHPIGFTNIGLFRCLRLYPAISRLSRTPSNATALNRTNVCAYRTKDYSMATAQENGINTCAYQQHVFSATFDNTVSLFTTWPSDYTFRGHASFFVGSFRLPHAFQHKNVAVMLYDLTVKKHFAEKEPLRFTHAYFPVEFFDEYRVDGRYAFCRRGNALAAIIGTGDLELADKDERVAEEFKSTQAFELRQHDKRHAWIFELSGVDDEGGFESFVERIKSNPVTFCAEDNRVAYRSADREVAVQFGKGSFVNGEKIDTRHKRFDSAYCVAEQKADEIVIACDGATLTLNKHTLTRQEECSS